MNLESERGAHLKDFLKSQGLIIKSHVGRKVKDFMRLKKCLTLFIGSNLQVLRLEIGNIYMYWI